MFKKILVPIDGSHTADLGLAEAIKVAKDQKAAVYLVHIVDELAVVQNAGASGATYIGGVLDIMREDGKKILAKAEAKVRKQGVRSKSLLIEKIGGPISDLIIEQAIKWRADLIVLGTHGRRGTRRMVLGSDAEAVVRSTHVPVLLVRSTNGPERQLGKRGRRK